MARGRCKYEKTGGKSRGAVDPKYCHLCGIEAEDSLAFQTVHLEDPRHKYNYLLALFKDNRKRKAKSRHGVEVNVRCNGEQLLSTDDGTVKSTVDPEEQGLVYEFEVKYSSVKNEQSVLLMRVTLLHPYRAFTIEDKFNFSSGANLMIRLNTGASYTFKVTFKNCGIGTYGVPVCFTLERESHSEKKQFDIIRTMVVDVIGPDCAIEHTESKEDSPFTGERWLGMKRTVRGTMPDGKRIKRLMGYTIPCELKRLFQQKLLPWVDMDKDDTEMLCKFLMMYCNGSGPNKDDYADYFHYLLYLEEYEATQKMEQYNMRDVPVEIVAETRLKLKVPGLAERRPSVLKGDLIYLRVSLGKDKWERTEYEGVVAAVGDTYVLIGGFNEELMDRLESDPSLHFDVHFALNRFPLYVMHRSIDLLVKRNMFDVVFPPGSSLPSLHVQGDIDFINPLIKKNPEQQKAVTNIVLGTSRPSPYIIFGPPGTGKTMTVVEAILQVKNKMRGSYMLVCAPANAACDLLAQKLIPHCTTDELLRLHSSSRDWSSVPEDLHPYSNRSEDTYYFPEEKQLHSYRIIVSTLIHSGRLLPKNDNFYEINHFTHVFIDECGQAFEPEALVPVAGILGGAIRNRPGGQIILAGDPMQLGPVCDTKRAEKLGLGLSLLERLMTKWKLYTERNEDGTYNDKFITKLRRNFRSHELILELPNSLFYEGELIPQCGKDVSDDTVKNLTGKPHCDHAVVFDGVIGQEKREGRSPSYFNQYELDKVVMYVRILLKGGPSREPVDQKDIGIIAPYIRQVYKLKAKLKDKGWENIEVGTTETYQGREKRVILISTVRSQRDLLSFDSKFKLGFVANAKRFNVAITRARSLLIIVGNPHLLECDPNWRELINFTQKLGSYRGCHYMPRREPRSEWVKEVVKRLGRISED